jgi:hypothetical protein
MSGVPEVTMWWVTSPVDVHTAQQLDVWRLQNATLIEKVRRFADGDEQAGGSARCGVRRNIHETTFVYQRLPNRVIFSLLVPFSLRLLGGNGIFPRRKGRKSL